MNSRQTSRRSRLLLASAFLLLSTGIAAALTNGFGYLNKGGGGSASFTGTGGLTIDVDPAPGSPTDPDLRVKFP